ncbi:hypothetical protein AMTR_s00005p00243060 [Amborella trichopoda]|uniref:Uncharacterized protein n=1 Tax=Amborella trichopoda TaxID=13333 RepID=W1PAE1_AMBTC|nr:hypothetical protein AMTR_s00005p00243060 [Amborella trichopoda]
MIFLLVLCKIFFAFEAAVNGGRMAAMIPELERIFEHSEAQCQGLVDMSEEASTEVALLDLLWNLQLEQKCLTSVLDVLTRQLEEATGAGRNDQPDEPQEPYFDSPF